MANTDLLTALAETGQGIKKLVSAVGEEMKSRSDRHARDGDEDRRRHETVFSGSGDETFKLFVCTRDMNHYYAPHHYHAPHSLLTVWDGNCPTPGCQGTLREVVTAIVTP